MWWILLIQLAYCIPLFIFYIITCYIIFTKRSVYKSSFFTIFLAAAPGHLALALTSFILIRVPAQVCGKCRLRVIYEDVIVPPASSLGFFLMFQLFFAYQALILLLALNRVSAILEPLRYESFWKKVALPLSLAAYIVPVLSTCTFLLHPSKFDYVSGVDAYIIRLKEVDIRPVFLSLIRFILLVTALTLIVNLLSAYLFIKRKSRNRAENALLFTSVAHFFIQTAVAIITTAFAFASEDPQRQRFISRFAMTGYPYVSDLATLTSPLLLLAFCKQLRNDISLFFVCKRKTSLVRHASRKSYIVHTQVAIPSQ